MALCIAYQNKRSFSATVAASTIVGLALGSGFLAGLLKKAGHPGLSLVLGGMTGLGGFAAACFRYAHEKESESRRLPGTAPAPLREPLMLSAQKDTP